MTRTLLLFTLNLVNFAALADVEEHKCVVLGANNQSAELGGFSVLEEVRTKQEFSLPEEHRNGATGVMCWRSSLVPLLEDSKVLRAGYPFYIADADATDQERLVILEYTGGAYQLRVIRGSLTADEKRRVSDLKLRLL